MLVSGSVTQTFWVRKNDGLMSSFGFFDDLFPTKKLVFF